MLNLLEIFRVAENPLEVSILNEQDTTHSYECILEFTFNLPHAKMVRLSQDKQEQRLITTMRAGIAGESCFGEPVYYFEKCRDGVVHMHGSIPLKGRVFIAGLIQQFCRQALRSIDGRLLYKEMNYYPHLERYRSPLMCVQFTDDASRISHWKQYITKCV